jgi:hypothetical protein
MSKQFWTKVCNLKKVRFYAERDGGDVLFFDHYGLYRVPADKVSSEYVPTLPPVGTRLMYSPDGIEYVEDAKLKHLVQHWNLLTALPRTPLQATSVGVFARSKNDHDARVFTTHGESNGLVFLSDVYFSAIVRLYGIEPDDRSIRCAAAQWTKVHDDQSITITAFVVVTIDDRDVAVIAERIHSVTEQHVAFQALSGVAV